MKNIVPTRPDNWLAELLVALIPALSPKSTNFIVGNLSFGQQKKVALLRVFLNDSDLIILDEPFVGLDSDTQDLLNQFLIEELNSKKGLIFTSHIKCEINSKTINLE